MRPKVIIYAARWVSSIFSPFYLPLVGVVVFFAFTYLKVMPWPYMLHIILLTIIFTTILPSLMIRFYQHYHGWTPIQLGAREKRYIPYVISIISFLVCYNIMVHLRVPYIITSIILAGLSVQISCAIINHWWKISTHTAGIGGFSGGLVTFGFIFDFDPTFWLNVTLIVAGLLGSARMILRQHNLAQVVMGYIVGALVTSATVLFL